MPVSGPWLLVILGAGLAIWGTEAAAPHIKKGALAVKNETVKVLHLHKKPAQADEK